MPARCASEPADRRPAGTSRTTPDRVLPRAETRARKPAQTGTSTLRSGQSWDKVRLERGASKTQVQHFRGLLTPSPGLEPGTCGLEVRCSIQLSYEGLPPKVVARRAARGRFEL